MLFCRVNLEIDPDLRYVTASHMGRMVTKGIHCSCHPCKLNRCHWTNDFHWLIILPQVKGSGWNIIDPDPRSVVVGILI